MVRRLAAVMGVLAAGMVAWVALRTWIPSGVERFYLALPPILLAIALVRSESPKQWWQSNGRLVLGYSVVVTLLSLWGCCLWCGNDASWRTRASSCGELLLGGYFLLAMALFLFPIFGLIRRGALWLEERWRGPLPASAAPAGRILVRRYAPLVIFVPLVLPFLLGVFFIHRLKTPNLDPTVALAGRPYEDVTLATVDGYTLRGWFLPAPSGPSPRTLLVCHGIASNRSEVLGFVEAGDALSANVLLFDFRGHGNSQGHTVSIGYHEKLDVLAAIDYLRRERVEQSRELFGLGLSMGAGSLVRAAAEVEPPLDGLVLDSGFASAVELTDHVLRAYPASLRPYLTSVGLPFASLHAGCWLGDLRPVAQIADVRARAHHPCPRRRAHSRRTCATPVRQRGRAQDFVDYRPGGAWQRFRLGAAGIPAPGEAPRGRRN